MKTSSKHTNALIHSTSPYLLQHAHNPVNWFPWDDDLLRKEDENNKLLLVSIGYAACHWCHVMEHESFEDEEVAEVMNKYFICIKVDREERPDVDNYYMTAVHLMGLQGGWPLNIVALPDGRPVWGGTYFPKKTWVGNLIALARFWEENKAKAIEYAQNLQSGIDETITSVIPENVLLFNIHTIEMSISKWTKQFDYENGGRTGYPKFPMPVNLDFLLFYGAIKNDKKVLDFVRLTLMKMAFGGIYDQAAGGFARYATDEKWKIPHFEKMLYDNGQLIGLYSRGYQQYKQEEFKKIVYETTWFIERELMDFEGAFYSSLDADSEGVEGKFYVWNKKELQENIHEDYDLFSNYFNVNQKGFWEEGNYILLREMTDEDFAARYGLSLETLEEKIKIWKKLLLQERSKRMRPGLDDKTLISWNALVLNGLIDAYKAFADNYFKEIALKNARFIKQMFLSGGKLFHSWKQGKSAVNGFLDDYAMVIQAYVSLFEVTGDDEWLQIAKKLLEDTFEYFFDNTTGLFFYTAKEPKPAISNHYQIEDNVIPSANSVMAHNLHRIYLLYGNPEYLEKAEKMVRHIIPNFEKYPHAFANWGSLMLKLTANHYEIAVCGENAEEALLEMISDYRPNILWAISLKNSNVPLLKDRNKQGETLIYVCRKGACRLPVHETGEALKLIGG